MISRRVRDFDPVFVSFAEVSRASLLDTFDATSDYLIKGWHLYGTLRIHVLRTTTTTTKNGSSESPHRFPPCTSAVLSLWKLSQDLLGLTVLSRFGSSEAFQDFS